MYHNDDQDRESRSLRKNNTYGITTSTAILAVGLSVDARIITSCRVPERAHALPVGAKLASSTLGTESF
jgi:hypothetical protein